MTLSQPDSHGGKPCQRLTVRFDRAGIKTLSTAFAVLAASDGSPIIPGIHDEPVLGIDANLQSIVERLVGMPDIATDPFANSARRLAATLELFRFSSSGASLLDWAAMQTGMKDPLVKFSRQELEQYFSRFQQNLESHLHRLIRELRRQSPEVIAQVEPTLSVVARQALRRADARR